MADSKARSILQIAAAVGISRAGLLHHFESKEDLLMAVLDYREQVDRDVFRAAGSRREGGIGVLRGMVRLAQRNEQRPGLVRLYVVLGAEATVADHPAHEYFAQHYARIIEGTTQALEGVRKAGLLRPDVEPARSRETSSPSRTACSCSGCCAPSTRASRRRSRTSSSRR